MPSFIARARRHIGVSGLAVLIGIGAPMAPAAVAAAPVPAMAQVLPVAAINPQPADPARGFADLVEAVKPAVVSVYVQGTEPAQRGSQHFDFRNLPDNSPLKRFFQQFGEQERPARRYEAAGSGFAISADGYFVTNNHVVENADKVTVEFDDGTRKPASIVGVDKRTDLAVLKVDGLADQPYVQFADKPPRVGDWVIAMGNPFGLGGTVTEGVVSADGRDIGGSDYGDFLQIDAAVNRGNSGGPTFNMQGKVVGVNTEIYSPNGGNVGIAFDIPASVVQRVTRQLIAHGSVTRGYLGVSIQDVTPDIADSVGLDSPHGALVAETSPDTPAAHAGLQSGDVITEVDGKAVTDAMDLSRTIADKAPGTSVNLTVWRHGHERHFQVTLGNLQKAPTESGSPAEQGPSQTSVGLTVVPNGNGPGVLVQSIDPDSAAATKGIAVGDTILEVDNKKVSNGRDFDKAIAAVKESGRGTVLIKAERNGQIRFIGLPLDTSAKG